MVQVFQGDSTLICLKLSLFHPHFWERFFFSSIVFWHPLFLVRSHLFFIIVTLYMSFSLTPLKFFSFTFVFTFDLFTIVSYGIFCISSAWVLLIIRLIFSLNLEFSVISSATFSPFPPPGTAIMWIWKCMMLSYRFLCLRCFFFNIFFLFVQRKWFLLIFLQVERFFLCVFALSILLRSS